MLYWYEITNTDADGGTQKWLEDSANELLDLYRLIAIGVVGKEEQVCQYLYFCTSKSVRKYKC